MTMHPESIDKHPEQFTVTATLTDGTSVLIRPLSPDDSDLLGEYFIGLSETTRGFYGPHPFDQETADKICAELRHADILRLVAIVERDGKTRLIAYFLAMFGIRDDDRDRYNKLGIGLDDGTDSTLAPSVADAYQNTGIGSLVMAHVIDTLRRFGRKRIVLWGGVQERNARGVHFYKKFGFRKVGEFMSKINNYDMMKSVNTAVMSDE